jgi:hypothetical protein
MALPLKQISPVDAGRGHIDQNFTGRDLGVWYLSNA